ncbi:related to transcription/repair factor TFIIH subunit [Phialocephala subalpina]|uniref:RNA polymerase II transcription factor B subunit 2 n=1 Tax=Phialocephala subalpina TaxID=576137 RepID=A0A1L7X849_9HELO|nr:related to transcription/repair factor TFIIH subunit [Phialocephala subalpina]
MSVSTSASFEYLERLPGVTFRRLYQQPSTALAIFRRMLPHLAKTFVMALLYMTRPLPLTDLDSWVQPNSKRERDQALSLLSRLHIVTITAPSRDDPQTVTLTSNFGSSLRLALTGGGEHQSFGVPSHNALANMDAAFLDDYARDQWEGILHYVVSSVAENRGHGGDGPTASVKHLLEVGKLVTKGKFTGGGITQAGFSFLLQEVNAQVWTMLLLWIENAEQMGLDSVEVLSFLFMLGSLELGRAYSTSTLSESQRQMLTYLVDFGLVYVPSTGTTQFYPTRLATTLTSDATALRSVSAGFDAALTAASGAKGFIIIETNYRLYAYTSSPLQIAVLALFTRLGTRYPNMVSGRITRDSVARAISHGITSDQIISYLGTHAHPQLVKVASASGNPVLPPTVVDQIRLWQIENERMKATPGFLFRDFDNLKEYEACVRYADEIGVLTWKSDAKRMFFVTRHEQLRDYIKSRKGK